MTERYKYPRTTHLPWSPGATSDDLVSSDLSGLKGEVVITTKMDGENTTIYPDSYTHARSVDSKYHISRAWVKSFAASVSYRIPEGLRLCGENMTALHSIDYFNLDSYFLLFSVWEGDTVWSWEDTVELANELGVIYVPVLYRGTMPDQKWFRQLESDLLHQKQEGYVIRSAESFTREEFPDKVMKWVRKNHVQTNEHWTNQSFVQNGLRRR